MDVQLNPDKTAFQRKFAGKIRKCDELERQLRFLVEKMNEKDLILERIQDAKRTQHEEKFPRRTDGDMLDELGQSLQETERELRNLLENEQALTTSYRSSQQHLDVIRECGELMNSAGAEDFADNGGGSAVESAHSAGDVPLLDYSYHSAPEKTEERGVYHLAGVLSRDKTNSFERILYRAAKGNVHTQFVPVESATDDGALASAFLVLFHGRQLRDKIAKICASFGASIFELPHSSQERRDAINKLEQRIEDLEAVIHRSDEQKATILIEVGVHLEEYSRIVREEKSIYHTLNLFSADASLKCLFAEAWCTQSSTAEIQKCLRRAVDESSGQVPTIMNIVPTKETPPTSFRTNAVTGAFQDIVNAYGIARYRELNPALFTTITFPFLFAVMFGDIGHGFIMTLFSLFLIVRAPRLLASGAEGMAKNAIDGRYCLLLMGVFSIFTGFIYNETFAVPFDLFGTNWKSPAEGDLLARRGGADQTYIFGVDPSWSTAGNKLNFFNSLKMKLSIVLGVVHMILGILNKGVNARFFRNGKAFFLEFVPELLFLSAIFGYLTFLIVAKWTVDWSDGYAYSAPSLLDTMINMFMGVGAVPTENGVETPVFEGQGQIQPLLLLVAFICVPILLLGKPLALRREHNKKNPEYSSMVSDSEGSAEHRGEEEEFDFGEIMVHQIVHTIEYVLGSVSNTASYLRLWALSLAHAQLSEVFLERVLYASLELSSSGNPIPVIIGFAVWFSLTMGVLMIMESLSAFLHALRLHWVEYQNKFYAGDGIQFLPFTLQ